MKHSIAVPPRDSTLPTVAVEGTILFGVLLALLMLMGAQRFASPVALLTSASMAYFAARMAGLAMTRRAMLRESRALSAETRATVARIEERLARRGE